MNEAQVRTLEQVRQVVAGTQALEFRRTEDDVGRYAWIGSVLRRFEYGRLKRRERGGMLVYLQRLSGYSRAQVKRLVATWAGGRSAGQARRRARARLRAAQHGRRRGAAGRGRPGHGHVIRAGHGPRAAPPARYLRRRALCAAGLDLGGAPVQPPPSRGQALRHSAGYRAQRVVRTKTRPSILDK